MELRHLRTFATAADRESFTRAAADLDITQAAVSQQIAALERELDAELFQRRGRGVQLTERGQRLYNYARRILELVAKAAGEVGDTEAHLSGIVRIASSTVPSEWLLPELLAEFRSRWPGIREWLSVSDSTVATAAVEAGQADVGFVGELPRSSKLKATAVAEDELALVVAADHPLAAKGATTLPRLCRESLIVREPGSGSRRCVERELEAHGLSPSQLTIAMEVNNNDAIRAAVERGVGVAFLSQRAKRDDTKLTVVKVRGFHPRRQIYVIVDQHRISLSPARQFLTYVEEWRKRQRPSSKRR